MTRNSVPAELAVLTWPTLAWITAWQVMNAGPAASASQGAGKKPRRKPSRKRRARRRTKPSAKIIRFPLERVARPARARKAAAKIIPLPDSA